MSTATSQRGFSLIETVLFIVIVGIAVSAITTQVAKNVQHSSDPLLRKKAMAVANGYLDEIMRKQWNHNTPLGGGCVVTGSGTCSEPGAPTAAAIGNDGQTRASYDDVDDFHGLNEPPTDALGNSVPGYNGFTVSVTVTQPGSAWQGIDAADVRKVDVAVTHSNGETLAVTAYRVNY